MFGFPKKEHNTFKKNFLRTVVFQINFEEKIQVENYLEKIKEILSSEFPKSNDSKSKQISISLGSNQETDFKELEQGHNINLFSEDGQTLININDISITYTVSGKSYKNFASVKSNLDKLVQILSLFNIPLVSRVAIRKINIVEFKNNDDPAGILNFMLSPQLIGNLDYIPKRQNINQTIQTINLKENSNHLSIKYGMNIPPQFNEEVGQLIIDIDLHKLDKIEVDGIFKLFQDINDEIFNVFNWLINETTTKLLNDEQI